MIELSVVIPSYNRAGPLRACLQALAQQTLPAEWFEVVVAVDGSTDGTREMLAGLKLPYALRVVWQANAGQCAARNRGAAEAAGRYLLFLDDDVVAAPTLLAAHLSAQQAQTGLVGIGRLTMQPAMTGSARADGFARYFARTWNSHYDRLEQGGRAPAWRDCYSGNLSLPRAAFAQAGGFALDLRARFDIELGFRLEQQGLRIGFVPGAIGAHEDFKDFHRLAAEAEKQGRVAFELCRRHPAMLPVLLGGFNDARARSLLLRRLLLALGVPPGLLGPLGRLVRGRPSEPAWYEFLYSYCYWRGVRRAAPDRDAWRRASHGTTILMYHAFAAPGEPASRFVLPPRAFARQMAWLKWLGYRVISLEEYAACRRACQLPPARSVVITLDDGFAEVRTRAAPVLRRYGFPAMLFLVSGLVGDANRWDKAGATAGRPLLSWDDVLALRGEGLSIGAHTRTHPRLSQLSPEQALDEMAGSKADLESRLGAPVSLLAYPFGDMDAGTPALAEQAGFAAACSVRPGANTASTPCLALRRTEVAGTDSLLRFALSLWLGDDNVPARRRSQ